MLGLFSDKDEIKIYDLQIRYTEKEVIPKTYKDRL